MNNDKKHLLLVDDERIVLATLAMGLTSAGYAVSTAESMPEAEALLAGGEKFDLAILDVRMHGKSGLELAERLKQFDHIPFMLLTAYNDQSLVDQAAAYGALGYLVKPVDVPQLIPAIEAALARAQEISHLQSTGKQLQQALDNDRDISIAIGITMMQYRLGRKEAFDLLRKTARSQRCKLAEVAAKVISLSESLHLVADK